MADAPDRSEPRKTLATLYASMRAGDVEQIIACFAFKDAEQQDVATALLTQRWSGRQVLAVAVGKFGEEARKAFGTEAQDRELAEAAARVARVAITVDGDRAVVGKKVNPNEETELTGVILQKVGNDWKIAAETFNDIAAPVRPRELALMKALAQATRATTEQMVAQIRAGMYQSAQQAADAYTAHLQEAARKARTPATQEARP